MLYPSSGDPKIAINSEKETSVTIRVLLETEFHSMPF